MILITRRKFTMRFSFLIFILFVGVNGDENFSKSKFDLDDHIKSFQEVINSLVNSYKVIFQSLQDLSSQENVENILDKYDEMIEDLEAYLSETKISIGLQLEKGLENFNKTQDEIEQMLFGENNSRKVLQLSRARILDTFKQAAFEFNSFIGKGVDNILLISERGKELIQNWNDKRNHSTPSDNSLMNKALVLSKDLFT